MSVISSYNIMYMTTPWRFEVVQTTGSTNTDLMSRWHHHDLSEPCSLLAINQTAGRGRRGNAWVSQAHQSLTFSLAYPFSNTLSMMHLQGLTLACGLCVLKSVCHYFQMSEVEAKKHQLGLKWPNDILLGHRKLGGILVEGGQKSPMEPIWMIIGIGLNISIPSIHTEPRDIANLLELVSINDPSTTIEALWKKISSDMGDMLELFVKEAFIPFQNEWNHWNAWQDLQVDVSSPLAKLQSGKCLGVNSYGYLMINQPEGLQEISNGELRLTDDSSLKQGALRRVW
jgi:BirA family biotin operon repressor/biotin-[acetyl-CoA-carboxylase] ligase